MPQLTEARMRALVSQVLGGAGLHPEEVAICTEASVFADLRGSSTHGIVYIVPRTLGSLREGKTIPGARPEVVKSTSAMALVRGAGAAGPVLSAFAMALAMEKASQQGVGVVNVFNGTPIGLLGYYANLAAEKGMVGIVMANTAPSAAPYGAVSAVLGTNPFAYAAPSRNSPAIIFDVATTAVSSGGLNQARRKGISAEPGWLVGQDGEAVTDPGAGGVMLPCGGHKGSGLGILIHLLTGGLSLTSVGGDETHNHPDPGRRGQGAVFMAFAPEYFGSAERFREMVERQIGFIHDAKPLPGRSHPLYPGERGWAEMAVRRKGGIPVPPEDWATIVKAVKDFGLPAGSLLGDLALEDA